MIRERNAGGALLVAALVAALTGHLGPAEPAFAVDSVFPAGSGARAPGGVTEHTVTLVTGDRVTVNGSGGVVIQRGKGRQGVTFLARRVAGHIHVVPADALPLLSAGRLDQRLFDVTTLIESGYADRRADLPLIIRVNPALRATGRSVVTGAGVTVVRQLPVIDGMAVRAAKGGIPALWRRIAGAGAAGSGAPGGVAAPRTLARGLSTVWLDGLRKPSLDASVPQIGAPEAWRAGLDGAGVKIAVLDSGIDATHPDLAGQVAAANNFTAGVEDGRDRLGHGTHVASTIAGTGKSSGGRYRGVAPAAALLDGKVCVRNGCADSWILAGMQWAVDQGADVVNMSLGGEDYPGVDPLEEAVDRLTASHGTLFVIAGGNSGADAPVGSPASADAALAVGAVTKSDGLAGFSNRGPRSEGGFKPEISAPGVDIVAANSADGLLGAQGEPYLTLSGTSMATPHVAGAAAILLQRRPDLAPDALKALLVGSAKAIPGLPAAAQGAGRVDVPAAIAQTVTVSPPGLMFDRQLWPHADDAPGARTLTYRNSGGGAVVLDLTVRAAGPDGTPASAGSFTVEPSRVTVPAGGVASVTMTADTRLPGPDGFYTGQVIATGGGTTVSTPFGVDREVESYEITLRHLGRTGAAPSGYLSALINTETFRMAYVSSGDATAGVRLPKGRYALLNWTFDGEKGQQREVTSLAQPSVVVDGEQTLTVDARLGRPLSVTVPCAEATQVAALLATDVVGPQTGAFFAVDAPTFDRVYSARLGPDGVYPWMHTTVQSFFAKLDASGEPVDSPFVYNLSWQVDGQMITGFDKRVRADQLAAVRAAHATQAGRAGQGTTVAYKTVWGVHQDLGWDFGHGMPVSVPSARTEYYNTDGNPVWQGSFTESVPDPDGGSSMLSYLAGPRTRYEAGKRYAEQWNRGVFGPSLTDPFFPWEYVSRTGDLMRIQPPTHGDGEHHDGYVPYGSIGVRVYRDGVKVGELDDFGEVRVPAAAGTYRVESEVARATPGALSTKVSTVWTFGSAHVAGGEPERLPISVVRFSPELSQFNTAPAGVAFTIPVTVARQPGSAAAPSVSLAVQVSYDDGVNWVAAPVTMAGGAARVSLEHPDRAGFVSLRATASDAAGNTVRQTIIRAYGIE